LTATQLISTVMANTDAVLRDKTIYGRLNVGKAAVALNGSGTVGDTISPYVSAVTWNQQSTGLASVDVTFSEAMRATTLTAASIQVTGPNGAIAIGSITPLTSTTLASGTQWRITFANQTAAGKYTLTVLPTVTDVAGNLLDNDRDGVSGEATQDRFVSEKTLTATRSYTTVGPATLLDASYYRVAVTTIPIDVTDAFTINDLNVNVSIDHTYISDLSLRLIGPDGTSVQLVTRRGGSRDNLRVVFDDEATSSIATVTGDLQGTLKPERSLTAFDGKNAQGRWRLEITDSARLDVGRFNSVTLQFGSNAVATATAGTNLAAVVPGNNSTAAWLGYVTDIFDWLRRR
jgi:subtilisin-like proprotein convertase family protein